MVYPVLMVLNQRFMGEAFVARPLKIRRWTIRTMVFQKISWIQPVS